MKHRPHSRAVVKLAKMLVKQGDELMENGATLSKLGAGEEGRLRVLAGLVVSEVGQCILQDAHFAKLKREIKHLNRRIKRVAKDPTYAAKMHTKAVAWLKKAGVEA
jgi:uncharacterized protein YdcH (DUF465 family)